MGKEKDKWAVRGIVAGALTVLIGIAIGITLDVTVEVPHKAKWWELMTAVGTVGAAAAAVWLGLREGAWRRKQDRIDIENAKLYALSAQSSMLEIQSYVEDVAISKPYAELTSEDWDSKVLLINGFLQVLEGIRLDVMRIVDESAANSLIRAISNMRMLRVYAQIRTERAMDAFNHDTRFVKDKIGESRTFLSKKIDFQL